MFGPKLKMIVIIVCLTGILWLVHGVLDYLMQGNFFSNPAEVSPLSLVLTGILALLAIFFGWDNMPDWYEEMEEEIVQEFTLHEEPAILRVSLFLGTTGLFIAGIALHFVWFFLAGWMIVGVIVWQLMVELVLSIYVEGAAGISDFLSDIIHTEFPKLLAVGLIILILATIFSQSMYQGVIYPKPVILKPADGPLNPPAQEPTFWEKVKKQFQEWQSEPKPEKEENEPNKKGEETTPGASKKEQK